MLFVIHKLHIFANYWIILNKEYTSLKAFLATFCTEPVSRAAQEYREKKKQDQELEREQIRKVRDEKLMKGLAAVKAAER